MDLANLAESDLQRTLQKYDQLKPDQVRRTHQAPAGGQSFLIRDRKHYELRAIASILQEETGLAVELSSAETHLAAHLETMGNVVVRTPEKPAKVIGDIPRITTGHRFRSRREAHVLGAHRALQAGITGNREHGAESIVASDGYEDDEDYKTWLIYTGHGGRGGTGHQFGDQSFGAPGNAALRFSQLTGSPVRVIRGANPKSQNQHLPKTGLRYDGLYLVEDSWSEPGKSGNMVCRFLLTQLTEDADQVAEPSSESPAGNSHPQRTRRTVSQVKRLAEVRKQVLKSYRFTCQACEVRLMIKDQPYAEGAHIRAVGYPHNGPDVAENMLCLCPNCHAQFDAGAITVDDELNLSRNGEPAGKLHVVKECHPSFEQLAYHRATS
ncbi:HNH endonuclease [Saccharopolyspora sp. HNM0986]|uniref:YDG/SRA domain-containing protein n=1 Tax=Saccharopolyspora galaxeae TaxID=2781241 RepID=UPI001909412D|nr:YDG/SRA domain-containing protein [Saccharopolyspora sp. HNM0986]MBK0868375.1 HNH endonuclease [Saccharopolyspora sp. HNM0986]